MAVKLEKLTLATLNIVDPRIEKMFQKHIRQVMEDVNNRPGEAKRRKITLTFDLTPVIDWTRWDFLTIPTPNDQSIPSSRMCPCRPNQSFNRE